MSASRAKAAARGRALPGAAGAEFTAVDPKSVGLDGKPLREYEATIHRVVDRGVIPGCASVVYRRGEVVQADAYGFADVERGTPFDFRTYCRLYCATKPYICTAFFTLVEEGRASPEDRLDKYIPAFGRMTVLRAGCDEAVPLKRPILLRHLMSHTSGIGYAPDLGEEAEGRIAKGYLKLQQDVVRKKVRTLKAFVADLTKVPLSDQPGNSYYYGYSFDVLAHVLELITGQKVDKVLEERVFRPLGMGDTKWAVSRGELSRLAACYSGEGTWEKLYGSAKGAKPSTPRKGLYRIDGHSTSHWLEGQQCRVLSGGGFMGYLYGGLVSTVADTARFVRMLSSWGLTDSGERLLRKGTIAQMERNRVKKGLDPVNFLGNIGVFRSAKEYGMGGAACTYWSVDREDDVAIVWFTQHVDMPEFSDLRGVDPKKADLWAVLHRAALTGAKQAKRTRGAGDGAPPSKRAKGP